MTRDGPVWRADYEFDRDASAWAFYNSSNLNGSRQPWRPRDWAVLTPGVVLERVGDLDVLRTRDGGPTPRRISLGLTPRGDALEGDYPALLFTDGSVALFTGAFDVFALARPDPAELTADEIADSRRQGANARISWKDRSGPVLAHGRRTQNAETQDGRAYVLFGRTRVKDAERLVSVADPELPVWIAASLETFAPRVIDHYAMKLGPGQTDRPTILSTWYGPTQGTTNYGGSVLPGLIVMTFEGQELLTPSEAVLSENRWFIAHEAAHFWLGQTVRAERSRESWITEGGADLLAVRAMQTLDDRFDARELLQKEVDDCVDLGDRPVAGAGQRGDHRAYYACGAVLAMAAEALQSRATGGDWFDFLQPLIEDNRASGVLLRSAWLNRLSSLSPDAALATDIDAFLDNGSADPAGFVRSLFDRTGVGYERTGERIVLTLSARQSR
ncbi:hypothetical protein [Brevundimonas sp.]|uniref:hypothetical protein n=1 Tax=Brevundimonas sp. TaxID=1871086 RepID=UPI00198B22C4|nr:hypothetical protein [Brevundimonas sp.]MBD3836800.1 hypothetical protein [Brevundimonas sp.]